MKFEAPFHPPSLLPPLAGFAALAISRKAALQLFTRRCGVQRISLILFATEVNQARK